MELVIFRDDYEVGRLRLSEGTFSIGRGLHNTIALDDQSISRRHARLLVEGGRVIAQDLHSANGSFLGGQPLTEAELDDGDVLEIGPFSIEVRFRQEDFVSHSLLDRTDSQLDLRALEERWKQGTASPRITAPPPAPSETSSEWMDPHHLLGLGEDEEHRHDATRITSLKALEAAHLRAEAAKAKAAAAAAGDAPAAPDAAPPAPAESAKVEAGSSTPARDPFVPRDPEHSLLGDQPAVPASSHDGDGEPEVDLVAAEEDLEALAGVAMDFEEPKVNAYQDEDDDDVDDGLSDSLSEVGEPRRFSEDPGRDAPRLPRTVDLAESGGMAPPDSIGRMLVGSSPPAPVGAEPGEGRLLLRVGKAVREVFPLGRGTSFIGRADEMEVVILDTNASRRHAAVSWEDGAYIVRDLWSLNGISVNGERVAAARLHSGDRLRVGDTEFDFQWPDDPEPHVSAVVPPPAVQPSAAAAGVARAPLPSRSPAPAAPAPAPSAAKSGEGSGMGMGAAIAAVLVVGVVLGLGGSRLLSKKEGERTVTVDQPVSGPVETGGDAPEAARSEPAGNSEVKVASASKNDGSTASDSQSRATAAVPAPQETRPTSTTDSRATAPGTVPGQPIAAPPPQATPTPRPAAPTPTPTPAPAKPTPTPAPVAAKPAPTPTPRPMDTARPTPAPTPVPASKTAGTLALPPRPTPAPAPVVVPVPETRPRTPEPRAGSVPLPGGGRTSASALLEAAGPSGKSDVEKTVQKYYAQGSSARKQGRALDAVKAYEKALEADVNQESALYYQIEDEIKSVKAELAEQSRPLVSQAGLLIDSEKYPEARAKLQEALAKDPYNQTAAARLKQVDAETNKRATRLISSAQSSEESGDIEDAIQLYKQVLTLVPDASNANHKKAAARLAELKKK